MFSPHPIPACWEESQETDTDFVWQAQYFRCLREVPRDPTFLCGRCNIFDASEKFPVTWTQGSLVTPPPFCVAGAIFSMPPRSSPWHCERLLVTLPPFCVAGANVWWQWWPYFLFVWQVQYFRCDPISFLCGRCNIFLSSEKFLVTLYCTSFLCGRCDIFDASEKFPVAWTQGSLVTLLPFCVAGAIISLPPDPTYRLGRVTSDWHLALNPHQNTSRDLIYLLCGRLWPSFFCGPCHGFCEAGAIFSLPPR